VRRHTSSKRTSGSTDPSVCSASPTDTRRSQGEKYCRVASDMLGAPETSKHSTVVPTIPVCNDGCAKESNQLDGDTLAIAVPATTAPSFKSSSRADDTFSARSRAGSKVEKYAGTGSCYQSSSDRSDQAIQAKGIPSSAIVSCRNVVVEEASPKATCAQKETYFDRRTGLHQGKDANLTQGSFEVNNVPLYKSTAEEMPQRKTSPTAQVTGMKNTAQIVSTEKNINAVGKDISKRSLQSAGVYLNDDIGSEAIHAHEYDGNARDAETKLLVSKHVLHVKSVPNPLSFTGKLDVNRFGQDVFKVEPESALSTVDGLNVALDCDAPTKCRSKSRSSAARISSPTKTVSLEKKSDIDGSSVNSRRLSVSEVAAASGFSSYEPNTVDGDGYAKVVVNAKCVAQTNSSDEGTEFVEKKLVEMAVANAAPASGDCAALLDTNRGKAISSANSMAGKVKTMQGEQELGKSVASSGSDDEIKRPAKNPKLESLDDKAFSLKSTTKIEHGSSARIKLLNADKCDLPGGAERTNGVTEQTGESNHGKRKRREGVNEEAEHSNSGKECNNEDGDVEGLDRVREVLEQIRRLPEASPFLEPVDSSAPGCETYYGEIEHPRNLGTICGHLGLIDGTGYYKSVEAVVRDVNLVWSNCFQFNPSRDRICDLARICKTRFELLMERTGQVASNSRGARKSNRSTQGIHTRLLSDDRSVVALRRQKRMKGNSSTAASTAVQAPAPRKKTSAVRESTVQPPQTMTSPGAELVGHSLLVFCGLTLPGTDSEAVRWHHCTVLEYHEGDTTHDVLWVDFTEKSRHLSFASGSDYCIFKDRGLAS
jgi:hypothetical protein